MKSNNDFRNKKNVFTPEDLLKKPAKLDPIKKSGKEKRALYNELDEDDPEIIIPRKESILDFYDDGNDDPSDEEDQYDQEEYFEDLDENIQDDEGDYEEDLETDIYR